MLWCRFFAAQHRLCQLRWQGRTRRTCGAHGSPLTMKLPTVNRETITDLQPPGRSDWRLTKHLHRQSPALVETEQPRPGRLQQTHGADAPLEGLRSS